MTLIFSLNNRTASVHMLYFQIRLSKICSRIQLSLEVNRWMVKIKVNKSNETKLAQLLCLVRYIAAPLSNTFLRLLAPFTTHQISKSEAAADSILQSKRT